MTNAPTAERADDLRVARVHLRLGELTLARAELEDLLRRDALDTAGLAALAEVRWRTGDGDAAADAALAHLEAGGEDDVALCIAAEAMAAAGRQDDARDLMDRLPVADAATLDTLFAGMPRRAFWPAGPVDRGALDDLRATPTSGRPGTPSSFRRAAGPDRPETAHAPSEAFRREGERGAPADERRAIPSPREVLDATSGEDWSPAAGAPASAAVRPDGLPERRARPERRAKAQMDPVAELNKAREELDTKTDRALLRMSLVLRHDPTLAPAVLQILHLRREPNAALVRGDAQRLLGRHLEAEAAFDAAAESLEVP